MGKMFRFVLSCRILLVPLVVWSVLASCSRKSKHDEDVSIKTSSIADSCNVCVLDSLSIETLAPGQRIPLAIEKPVAIEFFNRYHLIQKYHHEETYDILMKIFNMKHFGDRSEITGLTDQYYYFDRMIRPMLLENSITVIDSIRHTTVVEFKGTKESYVINLLKYSEQDGVLMFNPNRKPNFLDSQAGV